MEEMIRDGDRVAVFHSIHRVMKAEQILKAAKVPMLLIPAPRQLSADCGLAIRFAVGDRPRLLSVLADADIAPGELFRYESGVFVQEP